MISTTALWVMMIGVFFLPIAVGIILVSIQIIQIVRIKLFRKHGDWEGLREYLRLWYVDDKLTDSKPKRVIEGLEKYEGF